MTHRWLRVVCHFQAGRVPAFFRILPRRLPRASRGECGLDGGEQWRRAALDQIEHALEVFPLAVIGIRNVAQPEFRRKVEEEPEMTEMTRRPQRFQKTQILAVHCHNPIESPEIIEDKKPRPLARKLVASLPRSVYRAQVRLLATLMAVRSG